MKVTDRMIYAYAGEPEITATDAHIIEQGLQRVLNLIDREQWPAPHSDPSKINLTGVSQESTRIVVDRAEYEQAKADGMLDHLLDAYLSDMDGETYVIEPDGTVINPYG